ncbi:hypothetical protein [Pseudoalteromonas piscicida]|uniref:Uncharacterized protein n=1 Tax=Pseudoalteromonas piscicida TaxID=43662 RepID=A0A2A5JN00_PSEO7|nr:hypothetical protein [Pseudoalteromonas piscicida]PCK30709.1 hypothetical protein CEX98_16315 [Pseudoalteromonas piscicida]
MKNSIERSEESGITRREDLDVGLIRAIFMQAYLAGREDGLNGIFIECNFAFENFLEQQYLQ